MNIDEIVISSLYDCGTFLREHAFDYGEIQWKGKGDPVTELDKQVEQMIIRDMLEHFDADFRGEEYGHQANGGEFLFYIDPIDGTKSFIRGEFNSAISVGVEHNGELIAGFVYDFMRDIIYVGYEGDTYLLFDRMRVEMRERIYQDKLRVIVMGDDVSAKADPIFPTKESLWAVDRNGSGALQMALLANGAFDGLVMYSACKGNSWDVAGGYYILKSRGFEVTDICGSPFNCRNPAGVVVAKPQHLGKILAEYSLGRSKHL
jgi:myo-inositol-1(or 4)-monophosphatase